MRLIVTGSSGQIGTNLALRCIRAGHSVLGIDRRQNPWTASFQTLVADLTRPFATTQLDAVRPAGAWRRPDVVVHLAAHAKVHALVDSPSLALENVAMAHHALELCRAMHAPIVLASSREVYGDVSRSCVRECDARFDAVTSAYAASKVAAETMAHAYARSYGLPHLVLRLSNVYGRYDDDVERLPRVVPLFIGRIRHGQPVAVFGADKVIDFTYVDDCVDGVLSGVERLVAGRVRNETINLASGRGRSLLELVDQIGRVLGRTPDVAIEPKRPGEVTRYVASLDKARTLLGYEPDVELEEGIERAVAWQLEWQRRSGSGRRPGELSVV
jgi:UDP-glucose 4-epimerase